MLEVYANNLQQISQFTTSNLVSLKETGDSLRDKISVLAIELGVTFNEVMGLIKINLCTTHSLSADAIRKGIFNLASISIITPNAMRDEIMRLMVTCFYIEPEDLKQVTTKIIQQATNKAEVLDVQDVNGQPPLGQAIDIAFISGANAKMITLLNLGASVDIPDVDRKTLVHRALENYLSLTVQERDARINDLRAIIGKSKDPMFDVIKSKEIKVTLEHFLTCISNLNNGALDVAINLLRRKSYKTILDKLANCVTAKEINVIDVKSTSATTALIEQIEGGIRNWGDIKAAEQHIEDGANVNSTGALFRYDLGSIFPLLMIALTYSSSEYVKLLLRSGVAIKGNECEDPNYFTNLAHISPTKNSIKKLWSVITLEDATEILLAHSGKVSQSFKDVVLSRAIELNDKDTMLMAMRSGAKIGSNEPLHHAASLGDDELLITLLELGLDINKQDELGYTPLHLAAGLVQEACVRILLNRGADTSIVTTTGKTALDIAGTPQISELFTKRTEPTTIEPLNLNPSFEIALPPVNYYNMASSAISKASPYTIGFALGFATAVSAYLLSGLNAADQQRF